MSRSIEALNRCDGGFGIELRTPGLPPSLVFPSLRKGDTKSRKPETIEGRKFGNVVSRCAASLSPKQEFAFFESLMFIWGEIVRGE